MSLVSNYKRDGYAVLRGAVPAASLPSGSSESVHGMLRGHHQNSVNAYLNAVRLISKSIATHQLFTSRAIRFAMADLGIEAPVFNTSPACHVMADDLKIPGGYYGIGAHQDYPALQSSLDAVVLWAPFFDVTLENYPVEVVPGSHLQGLLPAKPGEHISDVDDSGMEFVPVPVSRGDVLLFSVFTVHRTRLPGTGFRIAVSHRYENAAEPTWMERDYSSAQSRVIKREVDWTPSVEQVRSVFT